MKHLKEYFNSWDGLKLYLNSYLPEGEIKGVVLGVHGFGEYGSRYENWAFKFCEKGLAFIIYDQRGHGLTSKRKGVVNGAVLTKDLSFVLNKIKGEYPQTPIILYGHSMGGNISLRYLCDVQEETDISLGIISAPWLRLYKNTPLPLVKILKVILGENFSFKTKLNELSHDDAYLKEIDKERLGHKVMSLGLAKQVMENGLYILNNPTAIKIPVLLMSAAEDKIVDTKAIKELAAGSNSNISYINWEGMYHELHNEKERDLVFKEIIEYIDRQLDIGI